MAQELKVKVPPIVVVLGHVDHGKTTLLDTLRKTRVASREAGGITQATSASVVATKDGGVITFIDTPGHAAFAAMRSRGAKVADVSLLVVAADDGMKPQTAEALSFIVSIKTPYLVAITKTDLPNANLDTVKTQLVDNGVNLEELGGDVPVVAVSAKTGDGLDLLLETISTLASLSETRVDTDNLEASVIESAKEKSGVVAHVVVKSGKLVKGVEIESISTTNTKIECKVRGLFDSLGKPVNEIAAGYPGQILGFADLPQIGASVFEKGKGSATLQPVSKKDRKEVGEGQLGLIVKAADSGSLEALITTLPESVVVIDSGTGDVNESDVLSAKAANVAVMAYKSKIPSSVAKLAETEGVSLEVFEIIYKLLERIEEILTVGRQAVVGEAQILAAFPYNKQNVAGCKMVKGSFSKGDSLRLTRGGEELGVVKAMSLRKGKDSVDKVGPGEEFGVIFAPQLEFAPGDVLLSAK